MVRTVGDPHDEDMSETPPPKTLRRSTEHRVLGGVSAGLARYLRIDPVIVRIAFIVSLFVGGIGVVAYAAAWLLVPDDDDNTVLSSQRFRRSDDLTRVVGIVLVFFAAALVLGHWSWTGEVVLPLLLVAAGVWLLLRRVDDAPTDARPPVDGSSEDPIGAPGAPYTTTMVAPPPAPPAPPRPEPTGPPVTKITLALVIVAAGAFGLAAGVFPDLRLQTALIGCLAITGAGLVVGAFVGRGRPLIGLGIVLLAALSLTTAVDLDLRGGIGERRHTPADVDDVQDEYRLGLGEMVIDLRALDPADLRGEVVRIDADISVGALEIIVPSDITVTGTARAAVGDVGAFGFTDEGTDPEVTLERDGPEGAGTIEIDAHVDAGEIRIR